MSPKHEKSHAKCEECARKTILIGLVANMFLAAFKLFIGFLGRSRALIGSGLCNLSDITSSIVVIIGVKFSKKPADDRYPYGYGKVEFVAQFVTSLFMILGTVALIASSFFVIAKRVIVVPHLVVLFTAVLSAVVNALIYKFAHCGGEELNSPALKAHAEHNKIDVISSILVAAGVIVVRQGLHWVDPVIAIFECLHVLHGSVVILIDGVKGVMDTSLPDDYIEKVEETVNEVDGVKKVRHVRARQSGRYIVLDIALETDPDISIARSKKISQTVKAALRGADRYVGSVTVQVVPAGAK
ncbi:MAG: cation transporter [Candidatus Omnitrophica bacterium]|nr:cation transporter [Candidatus Omnitrophota bacterium]